MNKCILCSQKIYHKLTIEWLFSLKRFNQNHICNECLQKFKKIDLKNICEGCGRVHCGSLCLDCKNWKLKKSMLLNNRSLYVYKNEAMRDYFERYKFLGDYEYRKVFNQQFVEFIKKIYPKKSYVPIPVDNQTWDSRGFNQVCGLIEGLKYDDVLEVIQKTGRVKQSHKDKKERMNTVQPFSLKVSRESLKKEIVLIDDIYTTGSTLYHAQKLLLENGVNSVKSVTLCR